MLQKTEQKALLESLKYQLIKMTSAFCKDKLDVGYADPCKKMIEKMAKKKLVPFISGKIEIWAASIIYAIGSIKRMRESNPLANFRITKEGFIISI